MTFELRVLLLPITEPGEVWHPGIAWMTNPRLVNTKRAVLQYRTQETREWIDVPITELK